MKLTPKLILLFLLLSPIPLAFVSWTAYDNSRDAIEQNTFSRVVSSTILKEHEFNRWLDTSGRQIRQFASRPLVRRFTQILTEKEPTDPAYQSAHDDLLQNHFSSFLGEDVGFLDLSLLDSRSGLVLASSDPGFEGTYHQNEPYSIEGRKDTFVGSVRYISGLEQAAMYVSTPVKDEAGDVIAVIAARLDLSIMSEIMGQESGLNPTEETYLVNSLNLFVTDPKLSGGDFAFKETVHTAGVNNCLAGNTGLGSYNGYRNVPVIGAHRWLPERQLCILTEVEQSEAFAPIIRLRNQLLGIGGVIVGMVVVLGVVFARTITGPVKQLVAGTEAVGHGNLDYRININSRDEIGELAAAFNQMTARRQHTEDELRQARDQLEQRVAERTAELQKSEKKYRDLVDYAPVGIYQTTVSGDILYVNDTFARLMDFDSPEQMRESDTWARYKYKEAREEFIRLLQTDGVVINFEAELLTRTNRAIHVLISGVLNGHFISGMVVDITERKQAEVALRESEARLYAVINNAPVILWAVDRNGIYTLSEGKGLSAIDLESGQVVGQSAFDLFENVSELEELKRALTGEAVATFSKVGKAWFDVRLSPTFNARGEVVGVIGISMEITERKQAELALQESERTLSTLMSNLPGIAFRCLNDVYRTMEFVSEGCVDLTGYQPEDLINNHKAAYSDLIHPEDRGQVWNEVQVALQEDRAYTLSYRLITADKTQKWVWEQGSGIFAKDGTLLALEGFITDETERKLAQAALQESEARYRDIFNTVPVSIWEDDFSQIKATLDDLRAQGVTDFTQYLSDHPDFVLESIQQIKVVDVNQATLRAFQAKDRTELLASLETIVLPETAETFKEIIIAAAERKSFYEGEFQCQTVRGEKRVMKVLVSFPPPGSDFSRLILVLEDITERMEYEARLQYQANLLNNVSDAVIATNLGFEITSWNNAAEQIYGWQAEEVLGKTMNEVTRTDFDGTSREEMINQFLEKGVWQGEVTHYHKDGHSIAILASVTMLKNSAGLPIGAVAVNRDFTERKQAAQALAQYTAELARSNEELQQFAYVASHDLQEPLRMVASYLQLLERRYRDKLDDDAREFIDYAVDGSNRMKQLINDLLTYSRVGTRGKPFEPTDCEAVLKRVLYNLELTIADNQAVIMHDPLPTVLADDNQLVQLFQNLIGNALKYRSQAAPQIHIGAEQQGDIWRFSISDNGLGIEPEFFDQIFVIFRRLHYREHYPGTGIGLAVCKKIVERHGGRIWVDAQQGQGSTFYFTLPVIGR